MLNKKAEDVSMNTVVLVILVVVSIAVILIFVFVSGQAGKESANEQANIGSNITDIANCRLWGSGLYSDFDCSKISCPKDALCNACKNKIDISSCNTDVSGAVNCDTDCK